MTNENDLIRRANDIWSLAQIHDPEFRAAAPAVTVKRGYCTDCEQEMPIGEDDRGYCGHGRILSALTLTPASPEVDHE